LATVPGHVADLAARQPELHAEPGQQESGEGEGKRFRRIHPRILDNRGMDETPLKKSDQNLVWIDCEMTGLDPERDRIIEIAVIVTGPNLEPRVEGPVFAIHQSDAQLELMDAWNRGTHGKSGLTDKVKASAITEAQAEAAVLEFVQQYVPKQASPMC